VPIELIYYGGFKLPDRKARGVHAVHSCVSLAMAGLPVTLLLRAGPEDAAEALAPYGVTPPPALTIRSGARHPVGRLLGRGAGLRAATLSALRARPGTSKVVYTMDYPGLIAARRLLRYRGLLGYRFVFEAHNLTGTVLREEAERQADHPERRLRLLRRARSAEALEARCYPRLDGLVANSEGTLEAIQETFGGPACRMALPNGVELERFRPGPAEPDVEVIYTGSLDGWKGVDVLIDAVARLPERVRLRLVGFGEPPVVEATLARARDRGLGDRLEFLGYRPHHEVPELLARARIVAVSTSGRFLEGRRFTCPMKLLEAMAAGRPVVATNLPSIREHVDHEREALLFEDGSSESLAAAIRRLLDDEKLASRLGAAGRAKAEAYSWSRRADRLIAFLERVTGGESSLSVARP